MKVSLHENFQIYGIVPYGDWVLMFDISVDWPQMQKQLYPLTLAICTVAV